MIYTIPTSSRPIIIDEPDQPTPGEPMTTIVGLDPSLTSTGIAIKIPFADVIIHRVRSVGKKDDTWDQRADRLEKLADGIAQHIPNNSLVVIESPSYASVSTSGHDRSGLWWGLYHRLRTKGCTLVPVSPAQRMMYATGKGGGKDAGKDMVLAAAINRYPAITITGNDVADAVIFLAIGSRLSGQPLEETLPKTHLNALTKITLPERTAA